MALKPLTNISEPIPFKGGMVSKCEAAQLPFGGLSDITNMRAVHTADGKKTFKQRKGQLEKNTTAITGTTVKILSLFHFSKGQRSENHFFAQTDDGDIYDATDEPENGKQTEATFGTEVFSGSASQIPGSWSVLEDLLIHSNGVDQHKIYAGTANYVEGFIKYSTSAAAPTIPTVGIDYTKEVTDGLTTTFAVLDALDTYAAATYACIFIYSPVRINRLTFTFNANVNTTDPSTGTLNYRKSDNTWYDTGETDGTITGSITMAKSGTMYWTLPSDEVPSYMFGKIGFWYQWVTSAALSASVEITSLTYGTDHDADGTRTSFINHVNLWSGESLPVIQTIFYDASASAYNTTLVSEGAPLDATQDLKQAVYLIGSGDLTSISEMTTSDYLYFFTLDQIQGIYIDVGDTPNTENTTTFATNDIAVWTGAAFTSVGALSDQTSGLGNSGWITWARPAYSALYPEKTMGDTGTIGTTPYYGYLYRVKVTTATVSAGVQISIETLPFFDRLHLTDTTPDPGIGLCSSKWKDRMCYVFDRYPNYVYVSQKTKPMVLNGPDFAILKTGDGRTNKIVCMRQFHNELAIWQEEKGDEGGTLTLWQGDNPSEFSRGKLVLSTKYGTFSAKSAIVVDGIRLSGYVSDRLRTIMFWLSTAGVFMSDGASIWIVSDDISDLFDATVTASLRRGYENDHWISYDRTYNIIRIGLVTGTGTVPNTFRLLDLEDFAWYKDNLAQPLSCIVEAEGNATGKVPVLQYGGGVADGTVYQLNYGTNDVTTAIDAYIQMEFYHHGMELEMGNILVGMKVQTATSPGTATCTVTPYANAVAQTALSLSMLLENTSETVRRHKTGVGIASEQMSLKLQNNAATEEIHIFDVAVEINVNVDK